MCVKFLLNTKARNNNSNNNVSVKSDGGNKNNVPENHKIVIVEQFVTLFGVGRGCSRRHNFSEVLFLIFLVVVYSFGNIRR